MPPVLGFIVSAAREASFSVFCSTKHVHLDQMQMVVQVSVIEMDVVFIDPTIAICTSS
ncbi:hypothetical protein WDZ92_34475 [Nostoc sp. NIES-2111]